MVNVGEIEITGKVNSVEIEKGMKRLQNDFDKVSNKSKSTNADFTRMTAVARSLTRTLIGLGTLGAGGLLALASKAPAVAPALAQIKVESGRLTRILGEELRPAFDEAANSFSAFVDLINENRDTINTIGKGIAVGFKVATISIESTIDAMKRFGDNVFETTLRIDSFIDKLKTALGKQTQLTGEGAVFFKPEERETAIETSKRGARTEIPATGEVFEKGKLVEKKEPSGILSNIPQTNIQEELKKGYTMEPSIIPTSREEEAPRLKFELVEGGVADRIRDYFVGLFKKQTRRQTGLSLVDSI